MCRPLAFVLALTAILSLDTSPASATSGDVPASVLRLRGGVTFPSQGINSGWLAGGAIGIVMNRDVLLSVCYDHLDLAVPKGSVGRKSVDPVTFELELGREGEHRLAPRIAAGAGFYFHRMIYPAVIFSGAEYQRHRSLVAVFGMHFGVGLSIPLWKGTLMDLDYRYHQTVSGGGDGGDEVGAVSAGLRFLFPGKPADPEGYVESPARPESPMRTAYALR
jgi:hypothetical protein